MSLLTDPDDYAIACKQYSDSVVSIILGGRSAAVEIGHTPKKTTGMVDTADCAYVAGYLRFAKWLTHMLPFPLRHLLQGSALSLDQERPRVDLPSKFPDNLFGKRECYGLFNTCSIPEAYVFLHQPIIKNTNIARKQPPRRC